MATAKRSRLSPQKIEQLVLIKDNNERLKEILGEENPGDDSNVFDKIKMDIKDVRENGALTGSAVFEDGLSDGDDIEEEDDSEED